MRQALTDTTADTLVEVWFQDEARVGQKGTHAYVWARFAQGSVRRSRMEWQGEGPIGSRPLMVRDNRHDSAYLFGAICPQRGVGAGMITPGANTEMIDGKRPSILHLTEISMQVASDAHAVLVCDGAGWHQRGKQLQVPVNITLLSLPPYSPELNPMENVWDYLRQNKLSALIWDSYDAIVNACKTAWNWLIADPARISSIGSRSWACVTL